MRWSHIVLIKPNRTVSAERYRTAAFPGCVLRQVYFREFESKLLCVTTKRGTANGSWSVEHERRHRR